MSCKYRTKRNVTFLSVEYLAKLQKCSDFYMHKLEFEFAFYKNETFNFENENKTIDKLWYKILMKKGLNIIFWVN